MEEPQTELAATLSLDLPTFGEIWVRFAVRDEKPALQRDGVDEYQSDATGETRAGRLGSGSGFVSQ